MKKIISLLLVLTMSMGVFLTGCGKKSQNDDSNDKGNTSELSGNITFMGWGDESERQIYQDVIDSFMEENPGVTVEYYYTPSDYYTKLTTMISAGTTPDVFWVVEGQLSNYVNVCENLDPWLEKYPEITDGYLDALLEYGKRDGSVYAIPKDWEPIVMYINNDLFKASGVEIPTSDWTMDEFMETAKKMTIVENGETTQYGVAIDNYRAYWMSFMGAYGAEWFKDGKSNFCDENAMKGLKVMYDCMDTYGYAPTPSGVSSSGMSSDQMFQTGKVAMYVSGEWSVPTFKNECDFNWSAIEMPIGTTRQNCVISGMLCMSKDSKNKEASMALIKYMLSYDGLSETTKRALSMPPYESLINNAELFKDVPSAETMIATSKYIGIESQRNAVASGKWSKYHDIIYAELDNAFNGLCTLEEACKNIDTKANSELFN